MDNHKQHQGNREHEDETITIQAPDHMHGMKGKMKQGGDEDSDLDEDGYDDNMNLKKYISKGKGLESIASVERDGRISIVFDLKNAKEKVNEEMTNAASTPSKPTLMKTMWKGLSSQVMKGDNVTMQSVMRGVHERVQEVRDRGREYEGVSYKERDWGMRGEKVVNGEKQGEGESDEEDEEYCVDKTEWDQCPSMSIVIMIVGSRGDVQPYLALAQHLLKHNHRVRIATHPTFQSFVLDAGLEFYSIGGNPQDLMSYMVKNPGLMPGLESLTNGDIKRKRNMLTEMIDGCWRSCHAPDPKTGRKFVADAIISNPPTFAHVHCAEALGVPLLLSFTMPWSPTTSFAHPLVNITTSNAGFGLSNYMSYAAADLLTWQGIGDIINTFRTTVLNLEPLTITTGPGLVDRVKVPWTYCMSPALVPKPRDWKNYIDVVGFYFLDLASKYEPPLELAKFLSEGDAPVYIGFGSVVVDNPTAMTKMIFDATQQAGVRALVSAGWGGLGGTVIPPHIHILGNVPHDWLFANDRVCAVVHHGGAGTTAIGLAKGRPTVVVPFFGDQGFWGNMIHKSGAGPRPIPHKDLTVKRLREALKFSLLPTTKEAAKKLARSIYDEDGVRRGVDSFYKHLPLLNMRCDLEPTKLAVWWSAEHYLKLGAFAAQVLVDAGWIKTRSLVLHRPKEYLCSDASTVSATDQALGLFWSVTHPTGLTEVFQGKPKRERSVSPNPSHGIFNAIATLHEGFHDPLSPTHLPNQLEPGADEPSSDDDEKEMTNRDLNASKGDNTQSGSTVTTVGATTTDIRPVPPSTVQHRHSSSLTDTLLNALVDSAGCASENILGIAKQGSSLLNHVNITPTSKKGGQLDKDKDKQRKSGTSRWKAVQTSTGRPQEREIRDVRIEQGMKAVETSTKAQREHVIKRFGEEVTQTSASRKRYAESIKRAMLGGGGGGRGVLGLGGSEEEGVEFDDVFSDSGLMTTSPLGSPIFEGHSMDDVAVPAILSSSPEPTMSNVARFSDDPLFSPAPTTMGSLLSSRTSTRVHALSSFVSQPVGGEDDDDVFIRELETAIRLSLGEVGVNTA